MADPTIIYQGVPCYRGHGGTRYINNGNCVECCKLRNKGKLERHGYRSGDKPHPLYYVWRDIIQRCENPNNKAYKNYGGRGVIICDRWRHSFSTFLVDITNEIGERPKGLTLDRIDSDGHYQPGNMRWATRTMQARNRPRYVKLSIQKAQEIRDMSAIGVTYRDIAIAYDIGKSSVNRIVHNKSWK